MELITKELGTKYMPKFKRMFKQVSKKSFKLGIDEPTFNIIDSKYVESSTNKIAGQTYEEIQTIEFSPIDIDIGQWHVCAKIKTSASSCNLDCSAKVINGVYYTFYDEVPESELKKSPFMCDHCGNDKYKRSSYFILKNIKTERYAQVSLTCLKDFTKRDNAIEIANMLIDIDEVVNFIPDDVKDTDEPYVSWYAVDKLLPIVVYVYQTYGWVGVQKSKDSKILSSADIIHAIISAERFPEDYDESKCIEESAKIIEYHKNRFDMIQSEGKTENTNEFYSSISECVIEKYIEDKAGRFGMLCYAVKLYYDSTDSVANVTDVTDVIDVTNVCTNDNVNESGYIGNVYDSVTLTCKLIYKKISNTRRGQSVFVIMDSNGNKIRIFVGINTIAGLEFSKSIVGDVYELKGKVKDHDVYNGVKYTVLSHIEIVSKHRPQSEKKIVKCIDDIYV